MPQTTDKPLSEGDAGKLEYLFRSAGALGRVPGAELIAAVRHAEAHGWTFTPPAAPKA